MLIHLIFNFIFFLLMILMVPFMMFCERSMLGLFQLSLGVFMYYLNSLLLFMADALKMFSKFSISFFSGSVYSYVFSLFFFFFFILYKIFFFFEINFTSILFFLNNFYIFLIFFAFLPFPLINLAFLQNSVYSFLGNISNLFLLISYEIVLIFIFIFLIYFYFTSLMLYSLYFYLIFLNIFLMLFVCILCETSSVPFDLMEGESELVSGFNTELGSVPFIVIFLSEYLILAIFLMLLSVFFKIPIFILIILFLFSSALLVSFLFVSVISLFWNVFMFYLNFFFFSFIYLNF